MHEPVTTADGAVLAARFFPARGEAKGAVLLVPAMGTRQGYYLAVARWLSHRGFVAATFDYRGVGASLRGRPRDARADLLDWARLDCAAMLDALAARAPGLPITWVGHSLGGQIIPFVPNFHRVAKAVTVGSGSGWWRLYPWRIRWGAPWLWWILVPSALAAFGYFPGRRLRKIGDVPAGAMARWRRWCLHPEYAAGVEGAAERYAAVGTPIHAIWFPDDEYMSPRAVERLHAQYRGAAVTSDRLDPDRVPGGRIGHFGFFKEAVGGRLWEAHLLPALACAPGSGLSP